MNPQPALFICLADAARARQCAQLLTPLASSIHFLTSGSALLQLAPLPPHALLLLDGMLPDMAPQQLLERLQGPLPPIPCIAILPNTDTSLAAELIRLGVESIVVHDTLFELLLPYSVQQAFHRQLQNQMLKRQHMHQLSTLTAGMVHDIRNPLNGISAIMEALLTECGERVDLGDYQHHLRSQLTRLSSLLQDIQTLGTPHESEFLQQLDLVQLCRHSTNLWQRARAPQPLPSLTLQLPSHPLTISADPQKMQHALFNLLDNAARHSPPASSITLALQPLGPHWAQLSVSDEGQGITEAALPRILEPFFTTHKGSNGLGLPIVKNIVTMLEGTLEINNRDPASGVCATIRLPLVDYTP